MAAQPKVFISYAQETKDRAIELSKALDSMGVEAWLDVDRLQPGQSWKAEIEKAADRADSFVILVGPHNTSTSVLESEWQAALRSTWESSEKTMLPVIFGDAELPPFLRQWVSLRVDAMNPPNLWTRPVVEALLQGDRPTDCGIADVTLRAQAQWRARVAEIESAARAAQEQLGTGPGAEK